MKRLFRCLFFLASMTANFNSFGEDAKILEPLSGGKYDRIVTIKSIVEISDKSGEFLFNKPTAVKIADDGSVFIQNNYNRQLLKFSPQGKYIGNLVKKGEGPGEMKGAFFFQIINNKIYVISNFDSKYMIMDMSGKLLFESKVPEINFPMPVGSYKNNLILDYAVIKSIKIGEGEHLFDEQDCYALMDPFKNTVKPLYKFPKKRIHYKKDNKAIIREKAKIYIGDGKILIPDFHIYKFKVIDLVKKKFTASIQRRFTRIPFTQDERKTNKERSKKYNIPDYQYKDDIKRILPMKNQFWLMTSCKRDSVSEIDVFNQKGEYIDRFFLDTSGISGRLSYSDNNLLIMKEHSYEDDETYTFRLCKPVGL